MKSLLEMTNSIIIESDLEALNELYRSKELFGDLTFRRIAR